MRAAVERLAPIERATQQEIRDRNRDWKDAGAGEVPAKSLNFSGDPGGIRHLWPCGKSRTCARQVTYHARQRAPAGPSCGVAESLVQIGGPLWIVDATREVRLSSDLLNRRTLPASRAGRLKELRKAAAPATHGDVRPTGDAAGRGLVDFRPRNSEEHIAGYRMSEKRRLLTPDLVANRMGKPQHARAFDFALQRG
jgi:hypothetical protein